ncbi:exported hypothetical protein [Rhodococcus sp. RD6.2]|nr:exported hypothetical protein [Rhodococcus sp. RD6.2]
MIVRRCRNDPRINGRWKAHDLRRAARLRLREPALRTAGPRARRRRRHRHRRPRDRTRRGRARHPRRGSLRRLHGGPPLRALLAIVVLAAAGGILRLV